MSEDYIQRVTRAFPLNASIRSLVLETTAINFSSVYENVTLSSLPIYRWIQIVNDVTILAEETRHGDRRSEQALDRAVKVLLRLLEFLGFYLYVLSPPPARRENQDPTLASFVAHCLRYPSNTKYFSKSSAPIEGPSRWIYAKYPRACAKCGEKPCRCLLTPWIFEERRQKPESFTRFRKAAERKRNALKNTWNKNHYITIPGLILFFESIYLNSYYNQDVWKIVMHLSEEIGEATTELSRLELLFLMMSESHETWNTETEWKEIRDQTKEMITKKTELIACKKIQKTILNENVNKMDNFLRKLRSTQSDKKTILKIAYTVSEKFKEEVADVFSWLSAIIYKLSDSSNLNESKFKKDSDWIEYFKKEQCVISHAEHKLRFICPHCQEHKCSNGCLIRHAIVAEMYEKAAQL